MKIFNEFKISNDKCDCIKDYKINKNKNKFKNLQKYELLLKELKKNIEYINYKCQFKYLFISLLDHIKNEFQNLIKDIEKMNNKYCDNLKDNIENQNNFFKSIKLFVENSKNLYNLILILMIFH